MFFHMTYMTPRKEPAGTIKFYKDPRMARRVFGTYTDPDGNKWDICGFVESCVLARPISDYDRWNDTSSLTTPCGTRVWEPYKIEIIEEPK